ncbi:hypothetical protein O181_107928 [Austropuccinia psidii MF-1]|uniref:Uncharacterized protein n=1 Tax=Austropuccinia psidii MF-1 TaxID=1389203 RepID=A0A9Q3JTE6_9BASI|nr:hypothetical protein [Austropuccinia psidii MF-1]
MSKAIEAIENHLGPLDSSKILTLLLYFSLLHLHTQITSALDTQLAASPELTINMEDILDIVQQMQGRSASIGNEESMRLSKIDVSQMKMKMP